MPRIRGRDLKTFAPPMRSGKTRSESVPLPSLQRFRQWNRARVQARRMRRAEREGETMDYAEWVARHDTIDAAVREQLRQRCARLSGTPLISILMPVHNPHPAWLEEAIASVRAQVYPHWELCIADDCSTDPHVRALLAQSAALDPRIRIAWREQNGHISAASNSALELAQGEFVALLDHDDRLPEHALLCIAETVVRFPHVDIVYSDEDKLDAEGRRRDPYFKCDWNQELFRGQNLISHLGVYRARLVRDVGGFRTGYEGSQDYDLALRCIERVQPDAIVHIPHVLYHWRIHANSTASDAAVKPYAAHAGRRALLDHFARSGIACDVEAGAAGWYRCEYRLPAETPRVTIVVADTAGPRRLQRCLEALRHTDYRAFDVVVASPKKGVTVPAACNAAAARSTADLIAFLDSRCVPESPNWLRWLATRACLDGAGAIGAKLLASRRVAGNAKLIGVRGAYAALANEDSARCAGYGGRALLAQHITALGGGCFVMKRAHLDRVGGFDSSLHDLDAASVDLTYKLTLQGLHNQWEPWVQMAFTPAWFGRQVAAEEAAQVARRHGFASKRDAFYNDNLGLMGRFNLALPPRVSLAEPWFASIP